MRRIMRVDMGMVEVGQGNVLLKSTPLGSCIAVVGYSPKAQQGGMAHIMLPGRAPANAYHKTKYAQDAIDLLISFLSTASGRQQLQIFLVGAGNVLRRSQDTICRDNARSVTDYLQTLGVCIQAGALGGTQRRVAFLDAQTGLVSYTEGDLPERILGTHHQDHHPCLNSTYHA